MTSTTDEEPLILKTDALGRVRMPGERREAILDAFEKSGMSGQAFARHIGVKYPTFASWIQKRRRDRGDYGAREGRSEKGPSFTLLEATVESASERALDGEALEVETSQGLKLRIASKEQAVLAADLVRALGEKE